MKLGKTGDFPAGKLDRTDEGGLQIGIHTRDGNVIVEFATQVSWIGMAPHQAKEFARLIIARAEELSGLH